jgi:Uma2 family endonuclease
MIGQVVAMLVPAQHRFNVRAYYRMAESGVLPPDARVELLNGRIIDKSPIGPAHGGTVKQLSRLFNLLARGRWLVSTQDPVRLDDHSEPEPDVALLKTADDDYKSRHPRPDEVFLLIEVSDSTLDYNHDEKLPV